MKRSERKLRTKALPQLQIILKLADELAATEKGRDSAENLRNLVLPILAALGDARTNARLDAMSKSDDMKEASAAKSAMFLAQWWRGSNDAGVENLSLLSSN